MEINKINNVKDANAAMPVNKWDVRRIEDIKPES